MALITSVLFLLTSIQAMYVEASEFWIVPPTGRYQDKNSIYWSQKHNDGSDSSIRYRTDAYNISLNSYNKSIRFDKESNARIHKERVNVRVEGDSIINGEKVRVYRIFKKDVMSALKRLGVTAEMILSAENNLLPIYFNPIYDMYTGDLDGKYEILKNDVFGLQEMLALGWSEETKSKLPGFYNIIYYLTTANIFDIEYIAEDTNGNRLDGAINNNSKAISNPLHTDKAIEGETISHKLTDTNSSLKKNNTNYQYTYYYISYTEEDSEAYKKSDNRETSDISFSAPGVKPGTTLTIHLVYEPVYNEYYLEYWAVDENKKDIVKLDPDGYVVYPGEKHTKKVPTSWRKIKDKYNYQGKWYLSYIDENGAARTLPMRNQYDIVESLPTAKAYSDARINLIYSLDDAVPIPTSGPTPTLGPTSTPTPGAGPTPTPAIPPRVIPEPARVYENFTEVVNTGRIKADVRGAERFAVEQGIPTTESLYGEVKAKEYLLGYVFEKKVGLANFQVKVTKNYILEWETATPKDKGGPKPLTETVTVEHTVTVPREYGYWEILNLECYRIEQAKLENYALPNGTIALSPNLSYYSPPNISYYHSSNPSYHILKPIEAERGIVLPGETIKASTETPSDKPSIPMDQFMVEAEYTALTQTGNVRVRSDSLMFNGRTVITDAIVEREAPNIDKSAIPQCYSFIQENVLYKPNQIIDSTKKNGHYPSSGTISYTSIVNVNSSRPSKLQYNIDGLNKVVIHTPIICNPSITADNDKYVQLINPTDGCVQLVLDPNPTLSDFTVTISNTEHHSSKQGYYTRDFSKSIRNPDVSYISSDKGILKNQVQFPFDVYIDIGSDNNRANDDFIKAMTWITIGRSSYKFYLPMWTREGIYTVNFRTIAVNGEPYLNKSQILANTDLNNYVATESINVEVSGRIYGLSLYDISDYPMWEDIFRVPNSKDFKKDRPEYTDGTDKSSYNSNHSYTYSLGTNDQYGNDTGRNIKYTFPLVNGSHPQYKNQGILKTGYMIRFSLETTGNMLSDSSFISMKPNFYFVDKNGKNRTAVDLYYTEEINNKTKKLVKVGSPLDQINMKNVNTGDLYLGIPRDELKKTASLKNVNYSSLLARWSPMFHFSEIRLTSAFKTYVNDDYFNIIKSYDSYENVIKAGVTEQSISIRRQRWYGQYYIPNEVHVVKKDFDVTKYMDQYGIDDKESFWLKDGYIIVNFTIETVDDNGKRRLSYINANNYLNKGHCSMWTLEGPTQSKVSSNGPTFNFYAGDFVIYYTDKKMSDDYHSGAIY